jgi:Protein of unknown function (DUF2958)
MTLPENRPESWNFKMLSGEPLIIDQQFEQLLANGLKQGAQAVALVPVVKIFLPHIRWFLISLDADLDSAFAVVDRGPKGTEAAVVRLTDIVRSRLVFGAGADDGIRPERDKYIKLNKPWAHYLRHGDL